MINFEDSIDVLRPWAAKLFEEKIFPYILNKGYDFYKKEKEFLKIKNKMSEYLARTRAQCSLINSIAFPNVLKKVSDIYVPLTLSTIDSRDTMEYIVRRGDFLLNEYKRILIIDNAGMGKSTLMKKIVVDTIDYSADIPIYIELRTLNNTPISDQVKSLIGLENFEGLDVLKRIPFVYFFDGIDEIPFDIKNDMIKRIKVFSQEMINSKVIITSRPDQSLLELHSYSRFRIKPLEIKQSYELIKLYDSNSYKIGNSLILSNKLISEIKLMRDKDNHTIIDFLTTPLYVSLLFCSYKYKPVIPRRKDLFYSQVFEALFETHDLSKETGYVRKKESGLDITDFSIILRRLAFWCLKNNGKLEFTRAELESVITSISEKITGLNFKPINFIKDLTYSVPLFIKEGALYRWSHKSLMEYFCAEFICIEVKEKRDDLLLKMYESDSAVKFKNIIELCSDIDYDTFRKSILKKCLTDYSIHLKKVEKLKNLREDDKEIWTSISFFSDMKILLTPYSHTSLGDIYSLENSGIENDSFGNSFIGFQNYVTHITYPITLKSTVFEILRLRHTDYFFKEKDYYNRMSFDTLNIPENVIISSIDGVMEKSSCEFVPDIINIILQFRHTLSVPVIHKKSAIDVLNDIDLDKSNGVNDLLEGFD